MKTINLSKLITTFFLSFFSILLQAQHHDFIKRIRYLEKTGSNYWMQSEVSSCLNAGESARYTGNEQLYEVIETVNQEGELLQDRRLIYEKGVRDPWMFAFHRIKVGENSLEIYNDKDELILDSPIERKSENLLPPQTASEYGSFELDDQFLEDFQSELMGKGYDIRESDGVIVASKDTQSFRYDPFAKVLSASIRYPNGLKKSEQTLEFSRTNRGFYYLSKDSKLEWMLSDSGCCLKRLTEISRFDYSEETGGSAPPDKDYGRLGAENWFNVKVEADFSSFIVSSNRFRLMPLEVAVYNLSGEVLLKTKIREGKAIPLPLNTPAGMYLIHIISANRHSPIVYKLIKPTPAAHFNSH